MHSRRRVALRRRMIDRGQRRRGAGDRRPLAHKVVAVVAPSVVPAAWI